MTPNELADSFHTLVLELRNAVNVVGIFVRDLEKFEEQIRTVAPAPAPSDARRKDEGELR